MRLHSMVIVNLAIVLVTAACEAPGSRVPIQVDSGQPAPVPGPPVLIGTLVDGDGQALPRVVTTLNRWTPEGLCGGARVETDDEGRFRIDHELLAPLVEESEEERTVGLAGNGELMAFFDARQAFAPGVHDIGDLLFADPANARALMRLSDEQLLNRHALLSTWSTDARDACLRECARRSGRRIIAYLDLLEERRRGQDTDTALVTARNRAAGLADPLVLELVDAPDAPIPCTLAELPVVRLGLVNRDPLGRTLQLCCSDPERRDTDLAVDCCDPEPHASACRLIDVPQSGFVLGGKRYEVAPGQAVVMEVPLSHYLAISEPGRYRLRFAWRSDAFSLVDEDANELRRGVLFLYSRSFSLDVTDAHQR